MKQAYRLAYIFLCKWMNELKQREPDEDFWLRMAAEAEDIPPSFDTEERRLYRNLIIANGDYISSYQQSERQKTGE